MYSVSSSLVALPGLDNLSLGWAVYVQASSKAAFLADAPGLLPTEPIHSRLYRQMVQDDTSLPTLHRG